MYLTDNILNDDNVCHGFFGRGEGVSCGIYSSLNCALISGDEVEAVRENRRLVAKAMGVRREFFLTLHQVHGNKCVEVTDFWDGVGPEADAMVTDVPGLALGILTADCAPVLLIGHNESGKTVIGAAHAGWKSALAGVIENTVTAMKAKGALPKNIKACIGPCIGRESYEVDNDFYAPFIEESESNAAFFSPVEGVDGKYFFDLQAYVKLKLESASVENIAVKGINTCFNEEDYFSFRRATHRKEPDYGRQASVIVIKK